MFAFQVLSQVLPGLITEESSLYRFSQNSLFEPHTLGIVRSFLTVFSLYDEERVAKSWLQNDEEFCNRISVKRSKVIFGRKKIIQHELESLGLDWRNIKRPDLWEHQHLTSVCRKNQITVDGYVYFAEGGCLVVRKLTEDSPRDFHKCSSRIRSFCYIPVTQTFCILPKDGLMEFVSKEGEQRGYKICSLEPKKVRADPLGRVLVMRYNSIVAFDSKGEGAQCLFRTSPIDFCVDMYTDFTKLPNMFVLTQTHILFTREKKIVHRMRYRKATDPTTETYIHYDASRERVFIHMPKQGCVYGIRFSRDKGFYNL